LVTPILDLFLDWNHSGLARVNFLLETASTGFLFLVRLNLAHFFLESSVFR
jgi:hypothetical protein